MTQLQKLIQKVFSDSAITYNEAEKLLLQLGYRLRITASHHIFKKEAAKQIIIKKRPQLLDYQILELRGALLNHGYSEEN